MYLKGVNIRAVISEGIQKFVTKIKEKIKNNVTGRLGKDHKENVTMQPLYQRKQIK